ncbi:hypothetical protein KKF34_02470 [Myxococcota bacterium]|nr:hypothetical protein [Myxococcota bacterium]MBU1495727.1 hypothetical protein [Myxococcota bacterium]
MEKSPVFLISLCVLSSTQLSACKKTDCEKLYEIQKKCASGSIKTSKSSYIEICERMSDSDEIVDNIKCLAKTDCSDFKICVKNRKKENFISSALNRLEQNLAVGNFTGVIIDCRAFINEEKISTKCQNVLPQTIEKLLQKAIAIRNRGHSDFLKCNFLRDGVSMIRNPDLLNRIESLCREMHLVDSVISGIKESKNRAQSKNPELAFQCDDYNLVKFDKIGTNWALERKKSLIEACFGIHGRAILKSHIESGNIKCSYRLKNLILRIKKHYSFDKEITDILNKIEPSCEISKGF